MYVRAGGRAFAWPYVGVHRSTLLMSSSILLQQCPACLVRLTWIVFIKEGRWPYSLCLVGCCRQDLFSIARRVSNHHHHHLVGLSARMTLTLSRHPSLSFIASGMSSGLPPYADRAAVYRFERVVLFLLGHVKGSLGVHNLWARPYFSSGVLHVWFV